MDSREAARDLRALHRDDLSESRRSLKNYLTEWLGGPKLYSPEKGHPRMRMRHMHVKIGVAARDAWLACMRDALDETVADEPARAAIYENMARLADWMRNVEEAE